MKTSKKIMALALAGTMAASSASMVSVSAEPEKATIGVCFYQDTGKAPDATKAFLESLSETLNIEFKYGTFTQTDEAANLTKVQELIASGVDGIIGTMDLGTNSILSECEAAGIYYGGYLCDFDTSYTTAYDDIFGNPNFVGTVADGHNPDDVCIGTQTFDSLIEYNERNADNPITHVSLAIFPAWAFPAQTTAAEQFISAADEYNKTAETPITVDPLDEEVDVLNFAPLDSTYFSKHPDTQAIISLAAGTSFVYPTMVSAGVDSDIKLFTTGADGGEENNFGSAGTQTYQQIAYTGAESIIYPLVLMLNKINGTEFADMPEKAERIGTEQYIANSDEDIELFVNSLYNTGDAANAVYTPEDVLNMTAFGNSEATYSGLVEAVQSLTFEE